MSNILLIATGGTRAPTQIELAERFIADGHAVRLLATPNALRFLGSHLTRRLHKLPTFVQNYRSQLRETFAYFIERPKDVPHISEGKWADIVVVAPATCNSLGKLAAGLSDNYPLLVLRAIPRTKRVLVVPSMNPEMWFDPLFQRNIDLLNATEKYRVLCPIRGQMLSGDWGFGAQVPIADIISETYRMLGLIAAQPASTRSAGSSGSSGSSIVTPPEPLPILQRSLVNRPRLVHIDPDEATRRGLAEALQRSYPDLELESFASPEQAVHALHDHSATCVLTEIDFEQGPSGIDLIEQLRRPGEGSIQIIATSARDRQAVGAERLARLDVLFVPKPFNLPFIVGMVGGVLCHGPQRRIAPATRRLRSGEVLFHEGERGSEVFIVRSGHLRITRRDRDREIELGVAGPGEMVGELSFINRAPRAATLTALESSEVAVLDLEGFRDYLDGQPPWLRCMLQSLSGHLRKTSAKLARIGAHTVVDELDEGIPAAGGLDAA